MADRDEQSQITKGTGEASEAGQKDGTNSGGNTEETLFQKDSRRSDQSSKLDE